MWKRIWAFIDALHAGKELANAKDWKDRQNKASLIAVVLAPFLPLLASKGVVVDATDMGYISMGIAVIGGLLNSYATVATTKKIGLPSQSGSDSGDTGPGGGESQWKTPDSGAMG